MHRYASDPETVRYMGWGQNNREDTRNFMQRVIASQKEEPRKNFEVAVTLKERNTLIGGGRISISDERHREGFIGYILNRDFWGQGYATELAQALIAFGFEKLGLHRIYATCDIENKASAHVMEKIGMQREGRLREHRLQGKNWRDQYLYAILDREWSERITREPYE